MTTIDRNPDIDLGTQAVPKGMTLFEGKNLMHTARSIKVPFGVASTYTKGESRPRTFGLIIRNADAKRFEEALAKKHAKGTR